MSESLVSQIVVGTTESFFPDRELSLKKVGRKRVINRDIYLNAVKEIYSMRDILIAKELGCNRSTVNRFRNNEENIETIKKAEAYLYELSKLELKREFLKFEIFKNIPIVKKFEKIMIVRQVSENKRNTHLRTLFNMCKYLKVHPKKLDVNEVADVVVKSRMLHYEGKKAPRGLAYSTQREAMRQFFMSIRNMSPFVLTDMGIDARALRGNGKYAKQKVSNEIRRRFEKELDEYCVKNDLGYDVFLELLNIARFIYYTATRITATLEFNFNERNYSLNKDIWIFEVEDKGTKIEKIVKWEKYLIGHALEQFKEFCSKRFKIKIEDLESKLTRKTNYLFPSFIDKDGNANDRKVSNIFRKVLIKAGLSYKKFQPTHIWRHTFAQEFLSATNWNYELCASLGGWKTTHILKKHYGEMGFQPKIYGLRKSMGMHVEDEKNELRW